MESKQKCPECGARGFSANCHGHSEGHSDGYSLSVPIFDTSLDTEAKRKAHLEEIRRAGVDRVFIIANESRTDPGHWAQEAALIREIIGFFDANGVRSGVWIGETIGHGGVPMSPVFEPMVRLDGSEQANRFCPLDPKAQAHIARYVATMASSGVKEMLLDDELRINETGLSAACACPRHLARIRECLGEPDLTREELEKVAFVGKANRYRAAMVRANAESLKEFCQAIRTAVDAVDPSVRIGLASAHSLYGIDGVSGGELARILAGAGNRPLLRMHGAPYWANWGWMNLPSVFEICRMFAALAKEDCPEAEVLSECDAYPRPRYNTPARYVELFDAVTRADGRHDGAMKYMFDYHSPVDYERGYVDRHVADRPLFEDISRRFPAGANEGVRIHSSAKAFVDGDFSLSPRTADGLVPYAAFACAAAGVPTVHSGDAAVHAAFGEDIRSLSEEELSKPLILDAVSARILTDDGIDCGLCGAGEWKVGSAVFLYEGESENKALVCNIRDYAFYGDPRVLNVALKQGTKVELSVSLDGEKLPLAYAYENADGRRFFVYLYDAMSLMRVSNLQRGYYAVEALRRGCMFLGLDDALLDLGRNVDLYSIAARDCDGRLSRLVVNCWPDEVLAPFPIAPYSAVVR